MRKHVKGNCVNGCKVNTIAIHGLITQGVGKSLQHRCHFLHLSLGLYLFYVEYVLGSWYMFLRCLYIYIYCKMCFKAFLQALKNYFFPTFFPLNNLLFNECFQLPKFGLCFGHKNLNLLRSGNIFEVSHRSSFMSSSKPYHSYLGTGLWVLFFHSTLLKPFFFVTPQACISLLTLLYTRSSLVSSFQFYELVSCNPSIHCTFMFIFQVNRQNLVILYSLFILLVVSGRPCKCLII